MGEMLKEQIWSFSVNSHFTCYLMLIMWAKWKVTEVIVMPFWTPREIIQIFTLIICNMAVLPKVTPQLPVVNFEQVKATAKDD